jgi:glycosyltransferase involved in cell wall biosynthesis
MLLTLALKRPELYAISVPELTRLLQFPAIRTYMETMFGMRYSQGFLETLQQRVFSYGDCSSLDINVESLSFGSRARYLLIGSVFDVSVIVPTWNEKKYLSKCLNSLKNQIGNRPLEVIVVDGGSTDGTLEVAAKYADKVLAEPGAHVGAARNIGAMHASGDTLAFIDADTVACDNWIDEIVYTLRANSNAVGVTGPTRPYEGSRLDELAYSVATGWFQRLSLRLSLPHVPGFNCAYRERAFWEAGGFDEHRQLSEDIMLGLKIRHQGPILFNPGMLAFTSLRRIKNYGYLYLTMYYAMNWAAMLLFDRTLNYPKVR